LAEDDAPSADRHGVLGELTHLGERRSRAALAGFVFAVLFVVGWLLLRRIPSLDASERELVDYFTSPSERRNSLVAGLYVLPFAGIAFIWYMGALRAGVLRTGGRESRLFSTVEVMAGTLFVASILLLASLHISLLWIVESGSEGELDLDGVRSVLALGTAISQIFALRSSAVFIGVSATRASRAGLLPLWFARASQVLALVLLLVATRWQPIVLIVPIWVVVTSGVVLAHRHGNPHPIDV
jgi:hypothetical protein